MRENLVACQQREVDGSTREIDHPARRTVWLAESSPERLMCAGGAGCFAKPVEYCREYAPSAASRRYRLLRITEILATLLNDGTSPTTNARILKKETVDEMFDNQIKHFPDFARQGIAAAKPGWTNPIPELYPQEGNPPQGWGLTFMSTIEPGATGRGRNTGWWAGIVNLFWWCDREKG